MDILITPFILCLLLCGLHTLLHPDLVEVGSSRSDSVYVSNMFNVRHANSAPGETKRCHHNVAGTNDTEDFTFFKKPAMRKKKVSTQNASPAWNFSSTELPYTVSSLDVFGFNKNTFMATFKRRPIGSAVTMVSRELLSIVVIVCLIVLTTKGTPSTDYKLSNDLSPLETKMKSLINGFFLEDYFETLKIKENYSSFHFDLMKRGSYFYNYYGWMKLPIDFSKLHLQNFTSYSLSVPEFKRVATFRNLPLEHLPQTLSVLSLANGGFSYRGRDDLVQCDVCSNEVRLRSFIAGDVMLDPKDTIFHRENCGTQTTESNNGMNDAQFAVNNCPSPPITGISDNNQPINSLQTDSSNINSTGDLVKSNTNEFLITSDDAASRFANNNPTKISDDTNTSSNHDFSNSSAMIGAVAQADLKGQEAACDDGYISDDPNFIDSRLFNQEHAIEDDQKCPEDIRRPMRSLECKKNPGHFAYFPLTSLILEQLPSKMRNKDFLEFLKCFGALTVRIVVKTISLQRNRNDLALKDPSKARWGTGWVSFDESTLKESAHTTSEKGKWRTVKKYVKTLVKKSADRIYITTNRHIVFDDSEAENTTVEFFFDEPSRKHMKVIKCVAMKHSGQTGDNEVVLECKTSDQEFLNYLQSIRQRIPELLEKIPRKIKVLMQKKPCIIHHPHGREKHLSYGDAVVVKYMIEKSKEGNSRMIKVNNQTQVGDIRKVLLYAADTCPGTSGAPVLTFQRGPLDASGQPSYQLDVWMHNGEEKNNKLGGTSMKELTHEDRQPALYPQNDTAEEESDEDETSPGNQKVSAPSIKVAAAPANPEYAAFNKRLESFAQAKLIHSHVYFARAGFYYGAYDDCVKCFCCGIGLKSWKPGDNVYEQHQKHRPGCRYLLSQMKLGEPYPADQWAEHSVETDQLGGKAMPLNLLQKENDKLKSALVCKVCAKEPVRDLFLPCGDLYACTGCSKLLTHCPSCKKQIMATVTTYLT